MDRARLVPGMCLAAWVLLAGCNSVFGLEPTTIIDGAVSADGPTCTSTGFAYDSFDEPPGSPPCTWGYVDEKSCATTVSNGELVMAPMPNANDAACGCGSYLPIAFTAASGAFVEVAAVGTGPMEYTTFTVSESDQAPLWQIVYDAGDISFGREDSSGTVTPLGSTPWNESSRWWRIRPREDGGAVLGETSPDGRRWTTIGVDSMTPPTTMLFHFQMGTWASESTPSTARIAGINVCP